MQDSYCFIVNCASNADKAEAIFKSQHDYLKSVFPESEFIFVDKHDSIVEISSKAAQKHSVIVACGGDGTVNKVANGILGTEAVLAVLPAGSGNDFAKSIGFGKQFENNIQAIKNKKITVIDAVQSDIDIFLNTFGVGLDGLTNYYASNLKVKHGALRYFLGGLKALFISKPFEIRYKHQNEDVVDKTWMVVVANGKIEGGKYLISPTSINNDGFFEVVIVKNILRIQLIIEFIKISLGFSFKKDVVKVIKARDFSFSASDLKHVHADGEKVKARENYHFSIIEKALPVITNLQ